jgi:hypothetical protein
MSAIPKVELVGCPKCDSAGGGCAFCGVADCDRAEHEGWTDCSLCGGAGELPSTVAAIYVRRAAEVVAVRPPAIAVVPDDDIKF